MTELDDKALQLVLEGEAVAADDELADSVARAKADVSRIRRGLHLLADEAVSGTPYRPVVFRRLRPRGLVFAAAGMSAAALIAVTVVAFSRDHVGRTRAVPSAPLGKTSGATEQPGTRKAGAAKPGPVLPLPERIAQSDRIIVGRVMTLSRGTLEAAQGLPYVLATISVERSLKPPAKLPETVLVFDYDLVGDGSTTYEESTAPWHVGDRVLLFLVSDKGSVSAGLAPGHLAVLGGGSGRYFFEGDQLVAPFGLGDVEHLVDEKLPPKP